ncbi:MAG: hypothetical protein RDU24_02740 [Humidesulfovibrio sp.]|uniref:hypothetical protein n=1 Tax=Humidesulfovibrio sp. TaxID=2910988 RepID=UPI0027EA3693|nr:hypothetical protein [Humidesulfovibrio sp.]MDQ7834275.1 hypothetical protein [Humidesulfovibrio sp.]
MTTPEICTVDTTCPSAPALPLALRLQHAAKESGLCLDQPWLLRRVLAGGLFRTLAMRFLRLKFSPLILDRVRALPLPLAERSSLFTQAISLINARETYKTTGLGRTRLVDAAVLRRAGEFQKPRLLEVGVSDGVSSLDLLAALPAQTEATLTDRHPEFTRRGFGPAVLILDGCGRVLGLKLFCLYLNLPLEVRLAPFKGRSIQTANPRLAEASPPLSIIRFDVCRDAAAQPYPLIKCANVFNRKYFPDATIRGAVANLGRSLTDGGYLFISQNNDRYAEGEAYFVLQKQGAKLVLVEERNRHEALELFQGATT